MPDGSRLVIGATTVALVGLASAGTAVLISNGTGTLAPHRSTTPSPATTSPRPAPPLFVQRPPGSVSPTTTRQVTPPLTTVAAPVRVPATAEPAASADPDRQVAVAVHNPAPLPQPVPEPSAPSGPVLVPSVQPPAEWLGRKPHPAHPVHPVHPVHPPHPDDNGKHLGQGKHP